MSLESAQTKKSLLFGGGAQQKLLMGSSGFETSPQNSTLEQPAAPKKANGGKPIKSVNFAHNTLNIQMMNQTMPLEGLTPMRQQTTPATMSLNTSPIRGQQQQLWNHPQPEKPLT